MVGISLAVSKHAYGRIKPLLRSYFRLSSSVAQHPELESLLEDNNSYSIVSSLKPPTCNGTRVHNSLTLDGDESACTDYVRGWAWQQAILHRRLHLRRQSVTVATDGNTTKAANDDDDCLLMWEHAPVYTLGRGADVSHLTFLSSSTSDEQNPTNQTDLDKYHALSRNCRAGDSSARLIMNRAMDHFIRNTCSCDNTILTPDVIDTLISMTTTCPPVRAPNQVPIYRVERGGEVTFHGPGQLVVYPLIDLKRPPYQADLHWYVRSIEQVIIQCLEHYNIEGTRDPDNTGVWVGDNKIAAVGVSASKWITTHGFALNVCPNMDYFDTSVILPCGIAERGVTSMAKILQDRGNSHCPSVSDVAHVILDKFEQVFGITLQHDVALR